MSRMDLFLAMLRYGFIWAGGGFGVHGSHTICRRLFSIMVALSLLLFFMIVNGIDGPLSTALSVLYLGGK